MEIGRNPVSKNRIQPECGECAGWRGTGLPNPSRDTKFSGANEDREILIFPVQLTTSRIGNLTGLIHIYTYIETYIHTYSKNCTSRGNVYPLSRQIRGFRDKYN